MAMMKALVRHGREPEACSIHAMPIPVIGPDEVFVEVAYAGICGVNAATFRSEDHGFVKPLIQGPRVVGHQRAGGRPRGARGPRVVVRSTPYVRAL